MIEGGLLRKRITEFIQLAPMKTRDLYENHFDCLLLTGIGLLSLLVLFLGIKWLLRSKIHNRLNATTKRAKSTPTELQKAEADEWVSDIFKQLPKDMKLSRYMTTRNLEARFRNFRNIAWHELANSIHNNRQFKEIVEKSTEFIFGNYNASQDSILATCIETEIIAQLSTFLSKKGSSAGVVTGSAREARMMALLNARNKLPEKERSDFTFLILKGCHSDYYTLGEQLKIKKIEVERIEELEEFKERVYLAIVPCSSVLDGSFPRIELLKKMEVNVHLDVSSDGFFLNGALDKGLGITDCRGRIGFETGNIQSISIDLADCEITPPGIGFLLYKDFLEMHHSIYTTRDSNFEKARCVNRITEHINPGILVATWLSFAKIGDEIKDHAKVLRTNTEKIKKELQNDSCFKIVGNPKLGRVLLKGNIQMLPNLEKISEVLMENKFPVRYIPKQELLEIPPSVIGGNGVDELIRKIKESGPKWPAKSLSFYQNNYDKEGVLRYVFTSLRNIDMFLKVKEQESGKGKN